MKTLIGAIAALVLSGVSPRDPQVAAGGSPPPGPRELRDEVCIARADARVERWRQAGMSPLEVERAYQATLAECTGDMEVAVAKFIGSVNIDLYRLAQMLIAGSISPTDYLTRARDRADKVRRAQREPGYAAQTAAADADGDLVPDGKDRCPDTPDLAPTDKSGCPTQRTPLAGPDAQEVAAALRSMNLMADPNCEGAPNPDRPEPVKIGYGDYAAHVAVERVENQPPGCLVLYEVDVELLNIDWESKGELGPKYPHVLFRSTEEAPSPGVPARLIHFQFTASDTADLGNRAVLASFLGQYEQVSWRGRAINGNGLKSLWSGWHRLAGAETGDATMPFTVP